MGYTESREAKRIGREELPSRAYASVDRVDMIVLLLSVGLGEPLSLLVEGPIVFEFADRRSEIQLLMHE